MIGAIEVHPALSRLDFPFDPLRPLGAKPILARTAEAILACPAVEALAILSPAEAVPAVEAALRGLPGSEALGGPRPAGKRSRARDPAKRWSVLPCEGGDIPGRPRIRRLRRLAPSSWRAGWAIPYAVAEDGNPRWLLRALERHGAGRLMLFPQAAPYLDPLLIGEMIREAGRHEPTQARLSTAPPGLAGDVLGRELLEECARLGAPADLPLRFLPDHPERALENKGYFHWFGPEVSGFTRRLTAESRRGFESLERIERLLGDGAAGRDGRLLESLRRRPHALAGPVPEELRLWITGRTRSGPLDPSPVPSGPDGGPGGPPDMDPALFARIAAEAGRFEECRLIISGGEPLLHPRALEVLALARAGGAGTVILETDGRGLGGEVLERIVECCDVVAVAVDAALPETYRALKGSDALQEVERGISSLLDRAAAAGGAPVVSVEFRGVEENRGEEEAFFDRWYPRTPFVVVRSASSRAGQVPARTSHPPRTPERIPCLRLLEGLAVLPGGRAVACENGFRGRLEVGDLRFQSLEEVWNGDPLGRLREAHARREWDALPLCPLCEDWCRR